MILADTTDRAALAADIREALTAARHGHELAEGIACRLPADQRCSLPRAATHVGLRSCLHRARKARAHSSPTTGQGGRDGPRRQRLSVRQGQQGDPVHRNLRGEERLEEPGC